MRRPKDNSPPGGDGEQPGSPGSKRAGDPSRGDRGDAVKPGAPQEPPRGRRAPREQGAWPAPPELPSFRVEEDEPPAQADVLERHRDTGLVRHDVALPEARIDADAARVVQRLERAGFQAYLVGGCVRDLLLNGKPKDFDVATSARPEDMRRLFRNCRIIGRRFRLAHVLFSGGKVIEVATFRKNPQEISADEAELTDEDLLIRSDNVFGDAHEDALRRDFTINALFYDLDRRQVLDWCGGMDDIRDRTIRTIGDPGVRFREDPVRILRAIKFAGRLDLGIDPEVYDAMVAHRDDLARAARPRLFEEILRLMRGGAAHRSMWLLWEMGAMSLLIPELAAFLDDDDATGGGGARFFRRMDAVDKKTKAKGAPLDDVVLFTTLLCEPLEEVCGDPKDHGDSVHEFLDPIIERIALPRRIADAIRRIITIKQRLGRGAFARLARSEMIGPALDVLELDLLARGADASAVDALRAQLPPEPHGGHGSSGGGGGGGRRGGFGRGRPRR